MIVDCGTYVWHSPKQLGLRDDRPVRSPLHPPARGDRRSLLEAGTDRHFAACAPVDKTIVLGFESAYLDALIPNDQVAAYVRQHPDKLIGFAGVDPGRSKTAVATLRHACSELGMRGVCVAPAAQDFHPCSSQAYAVYQAAAEMGVPVLFHAGPYMAARSKMEFAQPILLDEVAREFPMLTIVIGHMGFPWVQETLVLLDKHPNVLADVSWLLHQPWQAYQALLSALQYGVMEKLLFASGFPYISAAACIEGLYSLNQLVQGTNLPSIPREQLRGIVERDALQLLGIEPRANMSPRGSPTLLDDET